MSIFPLWAAPQTRLLVELQNTGLFFRAPSQTGLAETPSRVSTNGNNLQDVALGAPHIGRELQTT